MKLKEEYKNINIEKICLENANKIFNGNIPKEWLDSFERKLETAKNNYYEIYRILYLMAEQCRKTKSKLHIIGNWNGVLDNNFIIYPLLIVFNENYVTITVKNLDIKEEQLILESDNTNFIIDLLNEYCMDWKNIFIIKEKIMDKQ